MTALAHSIGRRQTQTAALTSDAVLVMGGLIFMWLLTQVAIPLEPFSPVPITGQTLAVLVIGAAFGAVRAGITIGLYLALGAANLPRAFAEGNTGIEFLKAASPTGGYLVGFLIAAVVVGYLAQRGWDRSVGSALGAMFIGEVIVFTLGVAWLANALDVGAQKAMEFGLYPFIIGDVIKLALAAGLLPTAWRFIKDKASGPTFKRS
ncbi:MAG TPA: biotin transporter BioY [Actinomycetota bacterium]|nr:biotin transporter BioY [Actinomycetota bacterium]